MSTPIIEIKPAPRANPEGRLDLPWNIFRDGRCTNIGGSRDDAEKKAERMREKVGGIWKHQEMAAEQEALSVEPEMLSVGRPRGGPDMGVIVEDTWALDPDVTHRGKVVCYLAAQFVVEDCETGLRRIIHVKKDNWKVLPDVEC